MLEAQHYTYRVVYLPNEQTFLGMCDEFMHLTTMAPSYEEAIAGIHQIVNDNLARS